MKLYRHKKTNKYVGDDHKIIGKKQNILEWSEHCITKGYQKAPLKEFELIEVPDFPQSPTPDEIKDIYNKYGFLVAFHYLTNHLRWSHPTASAEIRMSISDSRPKAEVENWFNMMFKTNLMFFASPMLYMFGHFSFDLIKFEQYLARQFGYDTESNQSMNDFMSEKFGTGTVSKFKECFLKQNP